MNESVITEILGWLSGNKEIIFLVIAGHFLPALAMVGIGTLSLPGFRQTAGVSLFALGKMVSFTLTQRIGVKGEDLEDAAKDFLIYALNQFCKGLDSDDIVITKNKAENETPIT